MLDTRQQSIVPISAFTANGNKDNHENINQYDLVAILTNSLIACNESNNMIISISANETTIIFQLNDSQAAKDFYTQLPMNIGIENYSHNEKIFYPPKKLETPNTPFANAKTGTIMPLKIQTTFPPFIFKKMI